MAKCKDCNFLHKDGHCGAWVSQFDRVKVTIADGKGNVEDVCPQFRKKTKESVNYESSKMTEGSK